MAITASFPSNNEEPWGDEIRAWALQVEADLNVRLSPAQIQQLIDSRVAGLTPEEATDIFIAEQINTAGSQTEQALKTMVNATIETGLTPEAAQAIADTPELSNTFAGAIPSLITRDALGRITSVMENGVTESYTRDAQGQIKTVIRGGNAFAVNRTSLGQIEGTAAI